MFSIYNNYVSFNNHISKNIATKILAKTKKLTLSSKKYNHYLESFSNISEEKTCNIKTEYDLPIIALKKIYKKKIRKTMTPKMNKQILQNFNISINRNNSLNRTLPKKSTKFFICDFDYFNNEPKINQKYIDNKYCLTQENFINSQKTIYRQNKGGRRNHHNINIKNNKEEKKQVFFLLDSVFTENKKDEKKKKELIYNEKEIFGYKDIYLDYLKNEIKSLINKEKQINMNSNINFDYNNKIYGKINMELNSAKIEVFNKINDDICCSFYIPFDILCLFYLSTVKQLANILLYFFRNNNFLNNGKISEKEMQSILENIITKQISYKNNYLIFQNNFEDEDKNNIATEYLNYRNLKYRTNIRYNILALSKKEEAIKKINFENCSCINSRNSIFNSNIEQNIYNENNEPNLFDSNINIIKFSWITLQNNYIIKIKMPQIIVKLPNYKKQINLFINKELLIFLYKKNFENYNFYISHYLFTLKQFRICIINILSYYTLFNYLKNKNYNKILNKSLRENNKNNLDINSKENNNITYEKYYLSNIKFEQYENSINDNEYIFFVSDDDYIHLYKMKSYVLFAYSCNDLKHPKISFFDFSFYQMKILFYKSKYENLVQFLQRLIKINKDKKKIYLDYNYFNSFKSLNNRQIEHYFNESYLIGNFNNSIKDTNENNNNLRLSNINNNNLRLSIRSNNNLTTIIEKDLILKISNPKFISVSIKKNKTNNYNEIEEKWDKKEGEIGRTLIEKLVENDIKKWGTILWENKDNIEALKNSKNMGNRRSNFFKGKKDFKAVFKKFLKIK